MRKTIIYIAILGLLSAGVWLFLFKDSALFGDNEAGFNIQDTLSVSRIFLASRQGDTVSLKRTADGWTVNEKYKASPTMVSILLETFREQKAAYPVPESAHNTVVTDLAGRGIKVEVYTTGTAPDRIFYVGGQAGNDAGTYMLMEGAKRPYVIQLPLFRGYVTPRYSTVEKEWRDRTVMDIAPSQLEKVAINYAAPDEILNNFSLTAEGSTGFAVHLHPELKLNGQLNARRVKVFSGFFEKNGCEGFLNGLPGLDSIISHTKKYCEIYVKEKSGKEHNIHIYWMPVNKRSKNLAYSDPNVPDEYDADRFYGIINNNKDTVILQRVTFDKFFRKGYEFYEEDEK